MDTTPDSPLMPLVGRRLREARMAAGLTVREAAVRIGLSDHSLLVRYENGLTQPPLDRLAQVAAVYGLSLAALLARHDAAVPLLAAIDAADPARLPRLLALLESEEERMH